MPLSPLEHDRRYAELGMEIDPPSPYSPSGWLALVAGRLTTPRADYRNPADQS